MDADGANLGDGINPDDPFGAIVAAAMPPLVLRCKIVLVGDSAAGKTALAQVFQGGMQNFPKNYNMTIGIDLMVKRVPILDHNGKPTNVVVEIYIVDCGGFAICQDLLKKDWETANAVMLVYDVSNPDSITSLRPWYEQLKKTRMDSTAIAGVVVACKTDLADRPGAITVEQGQAFASEKGLEFFEACAMKAVVDAPFHFIAECFYTKYKERKDELKSMRFEH